MLIALSAWTEHTDASRALARDVVAALAIAGIKHASAADLIGLDEKRLSRALAGTEALNLWRLAELPIAFWIALLSVMAVRFGASLISPEQVELLRGAARLIRIPKRMARMAPSASSPIERSA